MNYSQKRQEQAGKTERAILQSAFSLMRERGFDQVSVREICKAADITTGAFYHHFPSKEALFQKGFGPMNAYMEKKLSGCDAQPPAEQLRSILRAYVCFVEEETGGLIAQYYSQRLANPEAVSSMDHSRYIITAMGECFRRAQRDGVFMSGFDPEWVAGFCYRHFRGVVIDWILSGCGGSLSELMEEDYKLFIALFRAG